MGNLTFYARKPFLGNEWGKGYDQMHTMRLSSEIRAFQMAEYLGADLNPASSRDADPCIVVKPRTLRKHQKDHWVDICDGEHLLQELKDYPELKIIVSGKHAYDRLSKEYPNRIEWIPQQHLNWDNEKRDRQEVTTGGYIGGPSARKFYAEVGRRLQEKDFDWVTCYNYKCRQDAVNFYKSIDFLVIAGFELKWMDDYVFGTPAKMINAASFGVPSLAKPAKGFQEWEGKYIPVSSYEELVTEAEKLRDSDYYNSWSHRVEKAAQDYHISKIAVKYKELR